MRYNRDTTKLNPPVTLYPDVMEMTEDELKDLVDDNIDLTKLHKTWDDITKIMQEEHSVNCHFLHQQNVENTSATLHASCC